MKLNLTFLLLILLINGVFAQELVEVYHLDLEYDNEDVNLISVSKINLVDQKLEFEFGDYEAKLFNKNGAELFSTKFNFGNEVISAEEFLDEEIRPVQRFDLGYSTQGVYLPYFNNADNVKIFRGSNVLLEVDVSYFNDSKFNFFPLAVVLMFLIIIAIVFLIRKYKDNNINT